MGVGFGETGIDVLSNLPCGTCLCHFYQTREGSIGILVPFFKKGPECKEFCVWNTSLPLLAEKANNNTLLTKRNLNNAAGERNMVCNVSLYFKE